MDSTGRDLHRLELAGIDGGNLLAFMAAIGTLRLLTKSSHSLRMSWTDHTGQWTPVIHDSKPRMPEEVTEELAGRICAEPRTANPAFSIGPDLGVPPEEFARNAQAAASAGRLGDRDWADFIASFGCEACVVRSDKESKTDDTALRTMSGAGHQHFIGFMTELLYATEREHIEKALFRRWDYSDDKPSMRWDPNDYRPYALRATDPSKDKIKTVRGANRLAIEALPFFTTVPTAAGLKTSCFSTFNREIAITWPIWAEPLDCGTVRSLLSLTALQRDETNRRELAARGIVQVFRARRFTEGKFRNFSVARELM